MRTAGRDLGSAVPRKMTPLWKDDLLDAHNEKLIIPNIYYNIIL